MLLSVALYLAKSLFVNDDAQSARSKGRAILKRSQRTQMSSVTFRHQVLARLLTTCTTYHLVEVSAVFFIGEILTWVLMFK
jgi:hypothetical protein